jgi:glycosyltransferase involved in cell wall biosynthesis
LQQLPVFHVRSHDHLTPKRCMSTQSAKPVVLLNGIKLHEGVTRAPTGNFQHALHLAAALVESDQFQIRVLTDIDSHAPFEARITSDHLVRTGFAGGSVLGADRVVIDAIRRLRPAIYHRPTGQLPFFLPAVKAVATIADLNFTVLPTKWVKRIYKELSYRWTVRRADWLTCVSTFTRGDVIRRLGADPGRTSVILHGTIEMPNPDYGLADSLKAPFWLTFGHQAHKNVETCIHALASLPATTKMVVVGSGKYIDNQLRPTASALGLQERILFAGRVSAEQLSGLYRRALGLVFLSRYEGFGLPILEAMQVGCPVICSNCCSLPEVAGDAAVILPPEGGPELVAALRMVQTDERKREELSARGIKRASQFSWQRAAEETCSVYRHLLRNN